jgi:hypothetical protein
MRYAVKGQLPKFGYPKGEFALVGYEESEMVLEAPPPGSDDLFYLNDPNSGDGDRPVEISLYPSELEGLLVVAVRALAAHHRSTYRTVLDRALDTLVREDSAGGQITPEQP